MPVFVFGAKTPVPPGGASRVVVNYPRAVEAEIWRFVQQQRVLTQGVQYQLIQVAHNDPTALVIAISPQPGPAVVPANIPGMDPTTAPQGQRGMNRPDGQIDSAGFQNLGDMGLEPAGGNGMFEDGTDSTYSDIVLDGGGAREQPRH